MTPDRVVAMSQFLGYLTSSPALGDASLRALIEGALQPIGATAGHVYLHDGDGAINLMGSYGFEPAQLEDFRVISLALPFPLTKAFNTRQPVFVDADGVVDEYPLFAPSRSAMSWAQQLDVMERARLLSIPLIWQGVCIGVMGLITEKTTPHEAQDLAYLEAICHIVTLWVVGQAAGSPAITGHRSSRAGRQLTDRQRQILELIRAGKSNTAIGAALGYSVSTVKADIAGILSTLGAHDRNEAVSKASALGLLD